MAGRINGGGESFRRTANLPALNAFTLAGWGYRHTTRSGNYQYFAGLENATSNSGGYLLLGWTDGGVMDIASNGGTYVTPFGNSGPATATWFYWFLRSNGGNSYQAGWKASGGSWAVATLSATLSWTPAMLILGSDSYDEWCDIALERVRCWDAALTNTELDSELGSGAPVRTANLRANWPLVSDANDTTANAYHLTATGSVSYEAGPGFGGSHSLTATGVTTGAPTLGSAAIAQVHSLAATGITTGAPVLGAPGMAGGAALSALGVTTGAPSVGAPALGQVHGLAAAGIAVGAPVLGAPVALPLQGATVGGVLQVDPTNGRYFRNSAGPLVLAGFHTWASIQDSWPTQPIQALDFDEYLGALASYGCNFTKAWFLESARNWGDSSQYFAPHPWPRTGPGNAADGLPKFDLSQFNQGYFDRLRERIIRLGNAGIYVCVQLFQGWHVALKGGSSDPWAYHPLAAGNNVNGIDGDANDDGAGYETRSTTFTAVYNLQKAYVAKVLDTLNDLDNIFYEIANEEDSGSLTWQRALVDYIQGYEAGKPKQHPVGMTVCWPGGNNSDLYNTAAIDWLSPNGDYTPDAASTAKVSAFDTDHITGLTAEYKWIFRALCQGHNPWYMDEWAGETYGNDTRSNATYQRIRANLGAALSIAAQVDLASATPQGALSSTGYCLAKTSGRFQLVAYQDGSGAFTVNLSSLPGTFSLTWLRTAATSPTTQAGSNVTGGAVRTLTPPWAGEDAAALLQLASHDLAAANVSAGAPVLGAAAIAQVHVLTVTGVTAGAATVGAATIAQVHALGALGFAVAAPVLDAATIGQAHVLATLALAAGAPVLAAAAIAQVHALAAGELAAGAPVLGAPGMAGEAALTALGVTTGAPVLGSAAIAQVHALAVLALDAGAALVGIAAIAQVHVLAAGDVLAGAPVLGAPSMTGEAALVADGIDAGAPVLGAPVLGQVHSLVGAELAAGAADVGAPVLGQIHILTALLIVAVAPVLGAPALNRSAVATPGERTFVVGAEDRVLVVEFEDRVFRVD